MSAPSFTTGSVNSVNVNSLHDPIDNTSRQPVQEANQSEWRGRLVHKTKESPAFLAVALVIFAAITTVGILLCSVHPILGVPVIAFGLFCASGTLKIYLRPSSLEEALKFLTDKQNLNDLPEMNWKRDSTNAKKIIPFKPDEMTQPIMALKENGKTIAVAFKYFNTEYYLGAPICEKTPLDVVQVFSFDGKIESFNHGWKGVEAAFEVTDQLEADDGKYLEQLLRPKTKSKE
jgi:hypothetical protein